MFLHVLYASDVESNSYCACQMPLLCCSTNRHRLCRMHLYLQNHSLAAEQLTCCGRGRRAASLVGTI